MTTLDQSSAFGDAGIGDAGLRCESRRRVDFGAVKPPPSPSLYLSVDTDNPHQEITLGDLAAFLREISTLPKIQACGRFRGKRCAHWLCTRCGPRGQRADACDARQVIAGAGTVILWSATIERRAGRPLAEGWDNLDAVWRGFNRHQWLSGRVDGYARHTAISVNEDGWHPHFHTLLVVSRKMPRDQAVRLAADIRDRWMTEATRLGVVASAAGQRVGLPAVALPTETPRQVHRKALDEALARVQYATHQAWGHPGSIAGTPEGVLRAAAAGDADALDLWREIEEATHGHRLRAVGGTFRTKAPAPQKGG
jgi:hypothetical protein